MYRALLRGSVELPTLRACISAGEPLPASVARAWHEHTGIRIVDGIGSTEMLHIFIAARAEDSKFGSVGTPVPWLSVEILDEQGAPVAAGVHGEIVVHPRQAGAVFAGAVWA